MSATTPGDLFLGTLLEQLLPRLVDRIAVTVPAPELLSQQNVEAITGIPPRQYLETLRRPDFPVPVAKLGALRLVDRAAFVAWLRSASADTDKPANDADAAEETADDVLRRLGEERRHTPPARARAGRKG